MRDSYGAEEESAAGGADKKKSGGCLNLGWGCLPVLISIVMLPGMLLF
ncbi:MAG TPA: hypothetical protein VGD10_04140 [Allosphingosinicella sp.]